MSERGSTRRAHLARRGRSARSVFAACVALSALPMLLLASALSGCLDVDDDVDLAVDLYWDTDSDSDVFRGGSCSTAGVDRMEWRLINVDDDEQVEEGVDYCCPGNGPCQARIDSVLIRDPKPGEYALDIQGFDADDAARWGSVCDALVIARFDKAYRCEIPELPPP
jgi:hypothetical protein